MYVSALVTLFKLAVWYSYERQWTDSEPTTKITARAEESIYDLRELEKHLWRLVEMSLTSKLKIYCTQLRICPGLAV